MTIANLAKIIAQAPNPNAKVFICGLPQHADTDIGYNFDDNNDLDLYIISGEEHKI